MPEHMMDDTMLACMIASTLFGLIILALVIVQTVLQARILRELRKLTAERPAGSPAGPAPAPT